MTDVTPHPTAKLRAMNDFKAALANKGACEQLMTSGAVSEQDEQEPFAKVISWEEKQAIEQAFRIVIDDDKLFDLARKIATTELGGA